MTEEAGKIINVVYLFTTTLPKHRLAIHLDDLREIIQIRINRETTGKVNHISLFDKLKKEFPNIWMRSYPQGIIIRYKLITRR